MIYNIFSISSSAHLPWRAPIGFWNYRSSLHLLLILAWVWLCRILSKPYPEMPWRTVICQSKSLDDALWPKIPDFAQKIIRHFCLLMPNLSVCTKNDYTIYICNFFWSIQIFLSQFSTHSEYFVLIQYIFYVVKNDINFDHGWELAYPMYVLCLKIFE